jgi:hypothetical protein
MVFYALAYGFSLTIFIFLFWPLLWTNPWQHFMEALRQVKNFPQDCLMLYCGQTIRSLHLPWHYIPVWIMVTTPLAYSIFFFSGLYSLLKGFCLARKNSFFARIEDGGYLLWFLMPLVLIFVTKPVLYDGWRHLFFIYPAFLMIALIGFAAAIECIKSQPRRSLAAFLCGVLVFTLGLNMLTTATFMIRNHPFQNVYFNRLAGRSLQEAGKRFELDYWGLSIRQGLEYILKNDQDKLIKIQGDDERLVRQNSWILPNEGKKRFLYVKDKSEAKYFVTVFRWNKGDLGFGREIYAIKVGGAKIMAVYKLY